MAEFDNTRHSREEQSRVIKPKCEKRTSAKLFPVFLCPFLDNPWCADRSGETKEDMRSGRGGPELAIDIWQKSVKFTPCLAFHSRCAMASSAKAGQSLCGSEAVPQNTVKSSQIKYIVSRNSIGHLACCMYSSGTSRYETPFIFERLNRRQPWAVRSMRYE